MFTEGDFRGAMIAAVILFAFLVLLFFSAGLFVGRYL